MPMPRPALACLVLGTALLAGPPASAVTRGSTPQGVAYESGGIGDEELVAMRADFPKFDLWVTTAARKSGAWLAGVRVNVRDAHGQLVLSVDTDGPWLLAQLPPGTYDVEASVISQPAERLQVQRQRTEVDGKALRQVILYFDTGDEVSPEHEEAFPQSPYGPGTGGTGGKEH